MTTKFKLFFNDCGTESVIGTYNNLKDAQNAMAASYDKELNNYKVNGFFESKQFSLMYAFISFEDDFEMTWNIKPFYSI